MSAATRSRQPLVSSISANEQPIAEETSADGRDGSDEDRNDDGNDDGASFAMMRTGTKDGSAGNAPNAPSRAIFRHLNSWLERNP